MTRAGQMKLNPIPGAPLKGSDPQNQGQELPGPVVGVAGDGPLSLECICPGDG